MRYESADVQIYDRAYKLNEYERCVEEKTVGQKIVGAKSSLWNEAVSTALATAAATTGMRALSSIPTGNCAGPTITCGEGTINSTIAAAHATMTASIHASSCDIEDTSAADTAVYRVAAAAAVAKTRPAIDFPCGILKAGTRVRKSVPASAAAGSSEARDNIPRVDAGRGNKVHVKKTPRM